MDDGSSLGSGESAVLPPLPSKPREEANQPTKSSSAAPLKGEVGEAVNSAAAEDEVIFVPSESVHVIDSEHADPGLKTAIATAVPVKEVSEHDRLFYLARTSCFREIMGMPLWTEDPHKILTARDDEGHSLLHWAALVDDFGFIEAFCNLPDFDSVIGPDPKASNLQTPLMWAIIKGNLRSMASLYGRGASLAAVDSLKANGIILASQHNQLLALLLLHYWCQQQGDMSPLFDQRDQLGCSAAHWAAYKGYVNILRYLDYFGLLLDEQDNEGKTPLHRAAISQWPEACDFLIGKGCNPLARDNNDETPLDIARKHKNNFLANSLLKSIVKHKSKQRRGYRQLEEANELTIRGSSSSSSAPSCAVPQEEVVQNGMEEGRRSQAPTTTAMDSELITKEVKVPWWMSLLGDKQSLWVFPGFYLLVALLLISSFFLDIRPMGYDLAPVSYIIVEMLIPVCLTMFAVLVFGDPGRRPKRTRGHSAVEELCEKIVAYAFRRESYESVMNHDLSAISGQHVANMDPSRVCHTCWIWKGLRTKHCPICDCCVDDFDHHCTWLNNCVGGGNQRLFIAFCIAEFVIQLFHIIVAWQCLGRIPEAMKTDYSGWWGWISFVVGRQPLLLIVLIVEVLTLPWEAFIIFFQCRVVAMNMYTNEMINFHRYGHFWRMMATGGMSSIDPEEGRGRVHREFRNPFDKGIKTNCLDFWTGRRANRRRVVAMSDSEKENLTERCAAGEREMDEFNGDRHHH
ncbi:zinc finger protein DHHC domain containing protein, putative [Perkinsus marinus ATCC 50983]|uniref:Palmitoyltransferase n=1 Tax=Perkinsus marinus (strain ATCC 50983 / TXsc) TaxID=423536 RepID=C5K7X9_PERM5|nr:zinc finger protein DHHC domain containing protein, putative [Perkinsus marinus ATCC 50983]EER19664.1 zinc finger protein DHHC domain containing protein, putative [Perkinsus marinus ATCC 50983]|eukprot:XP_002787868.1 zinc finger protein DHHC domain containing protein, putative [Perkinsus marinus ATCC 50983]